MNPSEPLSPDSDIEQEGPAPPSQLPRPDGQLTIAASTARDSDDARPLVPGEPDEYEPL